MAALNRKILGALLLGGVIALSGSPRAASADPAQLNPAFAAEQRVSEARARQMREELMPLMEARRYTQAIKFAKAELGADWCDVMIAGREELSRYEWEEHFPLFDALATLARLLNKTELAAWCAVRSAEYTLEASSLGQAAFELSLITRKMSAQEFNRFYEAYRQRVDEQLRETRSCGYHPSAPLERGFSVWQRFVEAKRASAPERAAWLAKLPRAEKEAAIQAVADAWLGLSFEYNPNQVNAREAVERGLAEREEGALTLEGILPRRVSAPVSGPFEEPGEAFERMIDELEEQRGAREHRYLRVQGPDGERFEQGSGERSWEELIAQTPKEDDKPLQIFRIKISDFYAESGLEPGEELSRESACVESRAAYLLFRSATGAPFYALQVIEEAPSSDCGGYGALGGSSSFEWLEAAEGEAPYLRIRSAAASHINSSCGPTHRSTARDLLCRVGAAGALSCLDMESPSVLSDYFEVSLGGEGRLELRRDEGEIIGNMNPYIYGAAPQRPIRHTRLSPALGSVLEKVDGMSVGQLLEQYEDLLGEISDNLLGREECVGGSAD